MNKTLRKIIIESVIIVVIGTSLVFYTHRDTEKDNKSEKGTYVEKTANTTNMEEKAQTKDSAEDSAEEELEKQTDSDEYEEALEAVESGSTTEEDLERKTADGIHLEIQGMNDSVDNLIKDRAAFEYALKQRHMRTIASNEQVVTCTNEVKFINDQIHFYFIDEQGEEFEITYDKASNTYTYSLDWEE